MITPIEHTARIIESLPKAEAIGSRNCGHLGMIEKHEIFNGALDRLLARVARWPGPSDHRRRISA